MKFILLAYLLLTFIGPLWIFLRGDMNFSLDYQTADRSSAHIAPNATSTHEAVIQAYSARAFNWRGLLSTHTWIATKAKNASEYTVYQVIGWRVLSGMPALSIQQDIPDRYWYAQKPEIILDIRGERAEKLIPKIDEAAKKYPYPNKYETWPGPNSNTFIAFVAREVPELKLAMPSNAVGKDFPPNSTIFNHAPSGTGYQFSLYGLVGIVIAYQEGLEINLLGLTYGINPFTLTVKLPGLGDLSLKKPSHPQKS